MSVEAIIIEIEEKLGKLSGLPPDLSEQYEALRAEFAKKTLVPTKTGSSTKVTTKKGK